jgi:sugar lactone lactonase YvrE
MRRFPTLGWTGTICLAIATMLTVGCATQRARQQKVHYFFPPPPDEPRIQYLTGFGTESELGGHGRLADFILGGGGSFNRPILKPYGIAATKGMLYVCDTQLSSVALVDLARRRIRYLRPGGEAAMVLPANIAVDADGTRYVTDTKRDQVLMYDPADAYLGAIGSRGEMGPAGIAVSGDRLLVTDMTNHCVRVYSRATRELLFTVPRDPKDKRAKLYTPTNVAADPQGRIYVSDTGGCVAQIFDAEGNHVRTIGEQGAEPGRFVRPKGIGVDHEGRVYVVDAATAVVQVFDNEGRLLMFFGTSNTSGPAGLYLPAGLAIDYDNTDRFQRYVAPGYRIEYLILVINQFGPQKVSVFGFLRKS